MIKPLLQDGAFLADVRRASASERTIHLWWLGQSGYLVRYGNRYLVIDPYLSDSLTTKYANTDKPHVRMGQRVVDPAKLDFIDVITSSHNHTDHLDAETLLPVMRSSRSARLIVPEANRNFAAERLNMDPAMLLGLNAGQSRTVAGFVFTGIPAAHNELERDEQGRCRYMGYIIQAGPVTIYHSGDTLWHEEILAHLRRYPRPIDIALLPINGDRPERRVAGNLDASQAAKLAKTINARLVIPCHYDMFAFNTADPKEQFVPACEQLGQPYRVLQLGGRLSSTEIPA